jgi:hypothetical protein
MWSDMQPIANSSTFAGLVLLQIIQTLAIVAVSVLAAARLRAKCPRYLLFGWPIMGAVLFLAWNNAGSSDTAWHLPLFIGALILVISTAQFLQKRRFGERFSHLVGMNGLIVAGIVLLFIMSHLCGLNYLSPVKTVAYSSITSTYYRLGHHRISAEQAELSGYIGAATMFSTFVLLSLFWVSRADLRFKMQSYRYRLGC